MPKRPDDAAYLARLQDYYARWRSLPAYGPLRAVLGLASRDGVAQVLRRLRATGFLERSPAGRWTPTARFFARPLAEAAVPAGQPVAAADGGEASSIDAYLIRRPSRTVLVPVTGDSMIEAGIRPGDRVVVERDVPARPGDVVVAVIDGELTLKTLAVEDGEAVLVPANSAYPGAPATACRSSAWWSVWSALIGGSPRVRGLHANCPPRWAARPGNPPPAGRCWLTPVPAGAPAPANDRVERRLRLDEHLVREPERTFFARVQGDAWALGVRDGDLLVVDRAAPPTAGSLAVVAVGGRFALRRLGRDAGGRERQELASADRRTRSRLPAWRAGRSTASGRDGFAPFHPVPFTPARSDDDAREPDETRRVRLDRADDRRY
ncbi:MAG: S24 family peptidase [Albidovulum sp.]